MNSVYAKDNYHWILVTAHIDAPSAQIRRNTNLTGIANYGFHISGNYKDMKFCAVTVGLCMFREDCVKKVYSYALNGPIDVWVNDNLVQNISYPNRAVYGTRTYVLNTCDTVTGRVIENFGKVSVS